MKKRILSVLLALVLLLSFTTTAFAASGKTVTFNGGYFYNDKDKEGTIQIKLTNIATKKNIKIDKKELMNYVDDDTVANIIIGYDEDGNSYTLKDTVTSDKVTTYYANSAPVTITTKNPLGYFFYSYKGTEEKAKFTPKYFTLDDYIADGLNAKVYKDEPKGDWLYAPNTTIKITKPGKYIFAVQDDGFIDGSPTDVFCVIVK